MVDKVKIRALDLLCEYLKKYQNEIITKDDCKKAIIIVRMLAIKNLSLDDRLHSKIGYSERNLRKSNQKYGTKLEISTSANKMCKNLKKERVFLGSVLEMFLSRWQSLGATIEELLNICNIQKESLREEDFKSLCNGRFFDAIFVDNLDYKDDVDWLYNTPNAPLTCIAKNFMLYVMIHSQRGQEASQKALKECFPDLVFYQKITTDDGEYLMSSDGTEMIPLD